MSLEIKVCPRCGAEYSWIERRVTPHNVYLLAVHVYKEDGKRRVRKCYLGPEELYKHVERVHNLDALTNVSEQDYLKLAMRSLTRIKLLAESGLLTEDAKREAMHAMQRLANYLVKVYKVVDKSTAQDERGKRRRGGRRGNTKHRKRIM